jgi:hypothetical protein
LFKVILNSMKTITNDPKLVAFCGLYCGACKKFLNEKCPGCAGNEKAGWCTVRKCNLENRYSSCAECKMFENIMDCKKYNNFFSKAIGFVLRSDRKAGIDRIKEIGLDGFAREMSEKGIHAIKRK